MLKITAIGNLTNDVELKCHEDGKPYACALTAQGAVRASAPPLAGRPSKR